MQHLIKAIIIAVSIAATLPIAADAHHDHAALVKQHPHAFGPSVTRYTINYRNTQNVAGVRYTLRVMYGFNVFEITQEPKIAGCFTALVNTGNNTNKRRIAVNCFASNVEGVK